MIRVANLRCRLFSKMTETKPITIYDFKFKTLKGTDFEVEKLKGKVVLIVNTASLCGFSGQYKDLEILHEKYKDKGLEILAFPCNQFGNQEPGSAQNIQEYCSMQGVSFPLMEKIEVNGPNEHELYHYLKTTKPGLLGLTRIKWNFEKFLVNKEGQVIERFSSVVNPSKIGEKIEKLL